MDSNPSNANVGRGFSDGGKNTWTEGGVAGCGIPSHLYCFEIDRDIKLTVVPEPGRRVFLSTTGIQGDATKAGLDALCVNEAMPH